MGCDSLCCRNSGECDKWLAGASPATKKLAATVNGPLMHMLATSIGHVDAGCVEMFREGCQSRAQRGMCAFASCLLSPGAPLYDDGAEEMMSNCCASNGELLASIRQDDNEEELHKIALEDWEKDRMSEPVRASKVDTSQVASALPRCIHVVFLCRVTAGTGSAALWGATGSQTRRLR